MAAGNMSDVMIILGGENAFIYARPRGRNIEMMILVHEKYETVLVVSEFGGPRGMSP